MCSVVAALGVGPAPADTSSAEYAAWYTRWYAAYVAYQAKQLQQQQQSQQQQQLLLQKQHQHLLKPNASSSTTTQSVPQVSTALPSAAQTKLEKAMAYLKQKQLAGPSSAIASNSNSAVNSNANPESANSSTPVSATQTLFAKAAQFKPQSKKPPAYIPVKPSFDPPSYAAVVASKPTQPQQPAANPESLKNYVQRVFNLCPLDKRPQVEMHLKTIIENIKAKNALHTTDWDKMPLPPMYLPFIPKYRAKRRKTLASIAPNPALTTTISQSASSLSMATMEKKRKKFSLDLLEDRIPTTTTTTTINNSTSLKNSLLPAKRKQPKIVAQDDDDDSTAAAPSPSLEFLPPHLRDAEQQRRMERARRFQDSNVETSTAKAKQKQQQQQAKIARENARQAAARGEENPDVIDWDEYTIVGVCEKLEKSYLRLTSVKMIFKILICANSMVKYYALTLAFYLQQAPDPATVRPLHILRQTLEFLSKKWKQDQNYTYICDQFKSLRQDLTVQRIKNDFTVKVYESHARIALEKGDVGEYNQCQAQLKELYRLGISGCKDEFLAYRILYMVYTNNRTDQVRILSDLTPEETASPCVHHALRVRMAVATGDYHTFFHLYNNAPNMSVYLMDLFIVRERLRALKTLGRAFRPTLKVEYIARELGYIIGSSNKDGQSDSDAKREGVAACFEWLRELGTPLVDRGPERDVEVVVGKGKKAKTVVEKVSEPLGVMEISVDMKAAVGLFVLKYSEVIGKGVDIKGQIH
ncbi:hypothetical protein HK100_008741 [Physocladia obscura]|uniref:SAC3/GANP/THP3 conserved domain-containing protein n=1 Tax=Physocladia obscura TaxID=109957 RepID=A0AAD5T9S7_9FUNG|nr:hypothetical protein HK100_008741 [Physocladia obscura]